MNRERHKPCSVAIQQVKARAHHERVRHKEVCEGEYALMTPREEECRESEARRGREEDRHQNIYMLSAKNITAEQSMKREPEPRSSPL